MDVSAGPVRLLAWPIQRTLEREQTVAQVRRRAVAPVVDSDAALDAALLRAAAWGVTLLLTVPVAVVFGLIDGALPATAREIGWTTVMGLLAMSTLLTVSHAVRAWIAGETDDERWAARRRWIVPGNTDVVVAIAVVLAAIGATRL